MIRTVLVMTALGGCAQLIGVEDAAELRLSNLEVSTGTLVPAFDAEVASYTLALPYVGPSLAVTASADASVELTVDGVEA